MDEGVRLTTVSGEMEAETLCGLLRSAGIECGHRVTEETDSLLEGIASDGGSARSAALSVPEVSVADQRVSSMCMHRAEAAGAPERLAEGAAGDEDVTLVRIDSLLSEKDSR